MKKAETCRCYNFSIIFNCIYIIKVVLDSKIIYIFYEGLNTINLLSIRKVPSYPGQIFTYITKAENKLVAGFCLNWTLRAEYVDRSLFGNPEYNVFPCAGLPGTRLWQYLLHRTLLRIERNLLLVEVYRFSRFVKWKYSAHICT